MLSKFSFLLFTLIFPCAIYSKENCVDAELGEELIKVVYIGRHAHRAPRNHDTLKRLGFKESQWPNGLGQVTDKGLSQAFQSGKMASKYYEKRLDLDDVDYRIYSSHQNLTISSAKAFELGFHQNHQDLSDSDLVKIKGGTNMPFKIGPDLEFEVAKVCKNIEKQILQNVLRNETVVNFLEANKASFDKIVTWQSGQTAGKKMAEYIRVGDTLDSYVTEYSADLLPAWAKEDGIYRTFIRFNDFVFVNGVKNNRKLQKLVIGFLLNNLWNRLETAIGQNASSFDYYSLHGNNLAALMASLQIPSDVRPKTLSALVLELWRSASNYTVKFYLKSNATAPMVFYKDYDFAHISKHIIHPLRVNNSSEIIKLC